MRRHGLLAGKLAFAAASCSFKVNGFTFAAAWDLALAVSSCCRSALIPVGSIARGNAPAASMPPSIWVAAADTGPSPGPDPGPGLAGRDGVVFRGFSLPPIGYKSTSESSVPVAVGAAEDAASDDSSLDIMSPVDGAGRLGLVAAAAGLPRNSALSPSA